MNLLHIDSSILGDNSVSRALSAATVSRLTRDNPEIVVTHRDLAAEPLPHISGRTLAAGTAGLQLDQATLDDVALGGRILDEFLAADIVVIGVAFYNFSIPSQLKAWVDRIAIKGKTFQYSEKGAQGLVGGKRVILAIARGGLYGEGTPLHAFEHAESYLRAIFGFMGITAPEVVLAEGINVSPEQREASTRAALDVIDEMRAA
ncbi:FMN-dependent NADH-azoreductase [Terrihabitans rhizophilus]|uniref:FMN dependent NADH:quinone oxidoreductase n=1 Tax=Terrihabitans rhizophilus TaxID=3092662 RepID=A0ABU4RU28_9HYPH|nr:FMN-dependent NADH-azoreductase [Terrihabitans sp. PJ23]MDX6807648.1 FMN-dependent NADH-azoreductase [Terrihabitans sp. PJ23]